MPRKQPKPVLSSEVFARRLREVRERQRLSQQAVADRLAELGVPIDRQTVAKLEADPPQRGLSLDEALAICAVLGVSPRVMIFPADGADPVSVGAMSVTAQDARRWLDGEQPLRPEDERPFVTEVTEEDWHLSREPDWGALLARVRRVRDALLRGDADADLLLAKVATAVSTAIIDHHLDQED